MKYVRFTRGKYRARMTVPEDLRGIIGKRELNHDLGADKRIAEKNAHRVIAGFHAQIDEAKAQLSANRPTLGAAVKLYYREELDRDDEHRLNGTTVADLSGDLPGEPVDTLPGYAEFLRHVAAGRVVGDEAESVIGHAADRIGELGALADMPRADLLRTMAEIELDVVTAVRSRDKGEIAPPDPRSTLLTTPDPEPVQIVKKVEARGEGTTITEVVGLFHKERTSRSRTLATKTMEEHVSAVRMFTEFLGGDVPARLIKRQDLLDYKRALLETPTRYVQRFPGLTLPQAIRANGKRDEPFATLDPATVNMKWLSHLSTIFRWAMNNGHMEDNPAAGVRVDEGKGFKEPSRVPFSRDDLKRIFGSPLYLETPRHQWSTQQWALLVLLYTGARSSSEIARVRVTDVYQEQGVDVIDLALASKNLRSKRLVPIHDDLIKLGFLDYVARMKRKGERLFPDWEPEDKINRWFLRTYRAEVGINDSRKVMHGFRHTLKTALAYHGVNRDVSDLITGHADQSVGGIYIGDATVTMIKSMADGLNRVKFELPVLEPVTA
jgi:integrase